MLNAALALAARGFRVFPVMAGAKAPPLIKDFPGAATSDEATIRQWWQAAPNANVAIEGGGYLIVDVDSKKGGHESLKLLELNEGALPKTLRTRTPSGGLHCFYRLPREHRGVPNSVSALGRGLDIRSTGGYVVAPGSVVPAGAYAFEDAATEIAAAPDWLVDRLGTVQPRVEVDRKVPDAPEDIVERALYWLRTAERSVKGQGGDQAAYRVACRLRDLGLSYVQTCEAMRSNAWDLGCGWREGFLENKPIWSAYRYATGEAGGKLATAADFPAVEASVPSNPKPGGKTLRLAEFATQQAKGAGYVIKGALQRGSYAEVYGAPGEGKTFVAMDVGYHVAAGKPWMGLKTHGGPVLYLAYEGTGGMIKRAQALRLKYGLADVPLYIEPATFNLREQSGRQELGAVIAALPAKPHLIIIDTFARALMGGDENSAQDVGAFNTAIAALIEATGACVLIVHHSGKDKSKGARGSSALLGAIDTEIEVDGGRVITHKQRDVECAPPIGFKLVPLVVGIDEDGDETTSCVVEAAAVAEGPLGRVSGNARRGLDVLEEMAPDNRPISPFEWCERCAEFLGKGRAQRFYDLKKTLLAKGYIEVNDRGNITRRLQ